MYRLSSLMLVLLFIASPASARSPDEYAISTGQEAIFVELLHGEPLPDELSLDDVRVYRDHAELGLSASGKRLLLSLWHRSQSGIHVARHFVIRVEEAEGWTDARAAEVVIALVERIRNNDRVDIWRHFDALAEYDETALGVDWEQVSPWAWRAIIVIVVLFALSIALMIAGEGRKEWLFDEEADEPSPARWEWVLALLLAGLALAALGLSTWLRFRNYAIDSYDLTVHTHAFWHASQGHGFFNSEEGVSHLAVQSSPILYAILPLYLLWSSPQALLLINSVALASAVIPAWLLARQHLSAISALMATAVFVASPALTATAYDFQAVSLAVPLLLWVFWALEARRPILFLVLLVPTLACSAHVGLVVFAFGIALLFIKKKRSAGILATQMGLLGLVLGVGLVIPAHGGHFGGFAIEGLEYLGSGWLELVRSPLVSFSEIWARLTSLETPLYLVSILLPFAFLTLLSPRAMLLILPILLLNVLSSQDEMRALSGHYEALLLPGLFLGFVLALERLIYNARGDWSVMTLFTIIIVCTITARSQMPRELHEGALSTSEMAMAADEVIEQIPPGLSVLAPRTIRPFVSNRSVCLGLENSGMRDWAERLPDIVVLYTDAVEGQLRAGTPDIRRLLANRQPILENDWFRLFRLR